MRIGCALATVVLGVALATAGADDARPYAGTLPEAAPDGVVVVQVLDATTCRPLPGVRIRQYEENATVGFLRADLLAETLTDVFGLAFVRQTTAPVDCHWIFDRTGYGTIEEYGSAPPERVWLGEGRDATVRVLDPFGRPAAGLAVELLLGCGHSPAVRLARTDVDGRIDLRDIAAGSGDLWFRLPGALSNTTYLPAARAPGEQTPTTVIPLAGVSVIGTVRDADGEPVSDVRVTAMQRQRGPAVKTGGDGRFVLHGVDPDEAVWFLHPSYREGTQPFVILEADDLCGHDRPFQPLQVILPPSDLDEDDYRAFLAPDAVPIQVLAPDLPKDAGADLSLRFLDLRTGWVSVAEVDGQDEDEDAASEAGRLVVRLPPGEHRLLPGDPFAPVRLVGPERVTVTVGRTEPIVIRTRAQPRLAVDLEAPGVALDDLSLHLTVPGASQGIRPGQDEAVYLPAEGPAVLRVEGGARVAVVPVGPPTAGRRRARVTWTPDAPAAEVEEGAAIRVGPVVLLAADGTPVVARKVRMRRPDWSSWGETGADGAFHSRGQSGRSSGGRLFTLPQAQAPTPFVLEVQGYATRVIRPAQGGAHAVNYAAGAIDLTVTSSGGESLGGVAYCLDGMTGTLEEAPFLLRGVEPGLRTLVVGARDHGCRLVQVQVPPEGAAAVHVTLPRER